MNILNNYLLYEAITALTQEVYKRTAKGFTNEEMSCIEQSVQRDAVLGWLMQIKPPAGFTSLRRRYLNQQRAANQEMMNVHDPIFAGMRQETARWLSALPSSISDSYPSRELSAYKSQLQSVFNDIKENLLESFYPDDQEKKNSAEKDFTLYLDHIFEKYEGGGTGIEHLVYALQWAQAAQEIDHDQPKAREERCISVFNALNEARTAYEQDQNKYEEGHDWSCMPGLDERILDTMGMIKRSLEPEIPLEQQPFYKQYATRATDDFIGADGQPSLLFNSLCMRALMPAYETKTISISDYELTKDQQLIEAARAIYLEGQTLAVEAAQDSYAQWCQGQRELASLQPSQERTDLRRQQAWLYSAFQEFLDIKTEEDKSQTIKGLYEEQALQDLLIKKFNTQISNPATIKEQPWAQGLVIETTRSLNVVANQQAIFELLVDQHDNFKMSDEALMELMAQNTGITLDHVQLLNTLMAGGKGLSWFKESLLVDKPIPCFAVEALETKLNEIKRQLLALSLTQIERDPFAYIRHLVDDRGLIEAIAAIINHQDMNHLMLPCQDALLANVSAQITDSNRRNRLATLCVEHGFSLTLRMLLSGNLAVDANYIDRARHSYSLLNIAIIKGHIESIKVLLDVGVDINLANRNGHTPIFLAVERGNIKIVNMLLLAGANVNIPDNQGTTPLFLAAKSGNAAIARLLIAMPGINVNIEQHGYTPLLWAAARSNVEIVNMLLHAGARVNFTDGDGHTPIFLAAERGNVEIVRLLLEAGAPVNLADRYKRTPLFLAVKSSNVEMIKVLLAVGADANLADRYKQTPLLLAAQGDHVEIVRLLLEIGPDVNFANRDGYTPLLLAVQSSNIEMVKVLLAVGADANLATKNGDTPILIAARNGDSEIVNILLNISNSNVNFVDSDGHTPLFLAAKKGAVEIIGLLLDAGADLNIINNDGYAPLLWTTIRGQTEILQQLLNTRRKIK